MSFNSLYRFVSSKPSYQKPLLATRGPVQQLDLRPLQPERLAQHFGDGLVRFAVFRRSGSSHFKRAGVLADDAGPAGARLSVDRPNAAFRVVGEGDDARLAGL